MRKILKIIMVSLAGLILSGAIILYFLAKKNQDMAHQKVVDYLNQELGSQVSFRDFSLSYLSSFPKVQVEIFDLTVYDGESELLKISSLDVLLNLRSLLHKKVKIDKLVATDFVLNQVVDSTRAAQKLQAIRTAPGNNSKQSLLFEARKIELQNGLLCFKNSIKKNRSYIIIDNSNLKLRSDDSTIFITGYVEGRIDSLISNNNPLFINQPVRGEDISLSINLKTGVKELTSGTLFSNALELTPRLKMQPFEDGQLVELEISGEDNLDDFLKAFEFHVNMDLKQDNPESKLNLSFKQKGFVNPYKRPYSEVDFDISNAIFSGEDLPFPVTIVQVRGNYNNGAEHSPKTVELQIDTMYALVSESYLGGHFKLSNLKDPIVDAYISSNLDLSDIVKETDYLKLTGTIDMKLSVKGKISELRKLNMEGKQQASAEINIHNLDMMMKDKGFSIQRLNGTTILNNHILEISRIAGEFNKSAFHFNGHLENLDQYLLSKSEKIQGTITLNFDELDLKSFIPETGKTKKDEGKPAFSSSQVALELIINGKKVVTPIGDLKRVNADLILENDEIKLNYLNFDFQEGHVESSGTANLDEAGIASLTAKLKGDFRNLDIKFPNSDEAGSDKEPAKKSFSIPEFVNADIELNIQQGTIQQIPLSHLNLKARIKGNEIMLDNFSVNAFDGKTTANGKIIIDSTGLQGLWLTTSMDFNHLKPFEVVTSLGMNKKGGKDKGALSLPEQLHLTLDFHAKKLSYLDLTLNNSSFKLSGTDKLIEINDLHSDLPFGKLDMDVKVRDYLTKDIAFNGDVVLAIDSLSLSDQLKKEYVKAFNNEKDPQPEKTSGKKKNANGLPENLDVTLAITAKQLVYENINVSGLSMDLKYSVDGIELNKLDLAFADGKMHLEGKLRNGHTGTYPGHIYLKADDIDLQKILKSFDNFDQDDFTWENSSGKISIASHHYFRMDEGLSFIRDRNFWLGNILVHHAEFKQVEPIQNALFFIGHKAKDTMIVSELNLNILLSKNKIYFRDLLMNNNIANLALSGEIEVDKHEMDLWTAISLTDLFFRSKNQRIAETQEGIITLDTDSKLYLRMNGEFNNHKLDLVNVKNYNQHQDDIVKEITRARDTFKETRATYDQQRLK